MNLGMNWARSSALRGDYKRAAIDLVISQTREKSPQDVWAWWKMSLGRRRNFPEMTDRLVESILQEFHTGGELFRETVARMFGKRKAAARLPVNEFIEAVRRNKKRNCPGMPERFVSISPPLSLKRVAKRYVYPRLPINRGGAMLIDLRKDVVELKKLIASRIEFHATEAAKVKGVSPVSAIVAGFYLCQGGWAVIKFYTRPQFERDGEWSSVRSKEVVKIPQWKKGHDLAQAAGGIFILPNGKKLKVSAGVSCKRLAAIYGAMIKSVLLDGKKSGMFEKLPMSNSCQLDAEEFDGMWAWPKYDQPGKVDLARSGRSNVPLV